jgi:hypothetical protein
MQISPDSATWLLRLTAAETFENLALVPVDLEPTPHQLLADAEATAEVSFDGPVRGRLSLTVCGSVLATVAESMLAVSDVSASLQGDALGEVANVMCGNLIPRLAGRPAPARLAPPRLCPGRPPACPDQGPLARASVGIEQGRADVALYLERP